MQTFRRNDPNPFATLNPQQQAAVAHGRPPLLVLAGAGCGKTLTLAARLARLVLGGADPDRLLRTYAPSTGLPEQVSIIDRGDAEDPMAWMRQQQGLAATRKRFPLKATCLSIYSRCVNGQVLL